VILCQDIEFNPNLFGHPVSPRDWEEAGVKVLHSPTQDFNAPTFNELAACVNFMKDFFQQSDKSIYVHCKAGRGRSVAVVVCFLIDTMGLSTDQAIDFIQQQRSHINMGTAQTEACRNYEDTLKKLACGPVFAPLPSVISPDTSHAPFAPLIPPINTPPSVPSSTEPPSPTPPSSTYLLHVLKSQEEPWVGPAFVKKGEEVNSTQEDFG